MQCRQCDLENAVGRLTCRGCGSFLADADWEAAPLLSVTESPLYHGLVTGEECSLVQDFHVLCRQVASGEIDEPGFVEALQTEVSALAEFVAGIERTLCPADGADTDVAFVQLFRQAVDGFAQAADLLVEGFATRAFDEGLAAAAAAAPLLAQAFNAGELALKTPAGD